MIFSGGSLREYYHDDEKFHLSPFKGCIMSSNLENVCLESEIKTTVTLTKDMTETTPTIFTASTFSVISKETT